MIVPRVLICCNALRWRENTRVRACEGVKTHVASDPRIADSSTTSLWLLLLMRSCCIHGEVGDVDRDELNRNKNTTNRDHGIATKRHATSHQKT